VVLAYTILPTPFSPQVVRQGNTARPSGWEELQDHLPPDRKVPDPYVVAPIMTHGTGSTSSERPHYLPGPNHPITITPSTDHVVVKVGDRVVVDTTAALSLQEHTYPAVLYVPRADADLEFLQRSEHQTYCPFKGDAAYFSIPGAENGENAVWSYEQPYDAVAEIKDHLAFYPDRVEITQTPA
jgi:uncharacterized protein (DUF427 family)